MNKCKFEGQGSKTVSDQIKAADSCFLVLKK